MRSPLRAAACQTATADSVAANLRKVREAMDRAAAEGAELAVLPECALSGYLPPADLDFDELAEAESAVAAHAQGLRLWVAVGSVRREEGKWLNTALLYSPEGRLAARYDKTHRMPNETAVFAPGSGLPVFRIGEWMVGIQICFDVRFPENWRILRRKGAELVLHLSNASLSAGWKVPVLEGAVRSRAAENGMFVVSANDARRPQMMVSAICDPDGRHLACAPENEEAVIVAELDRALVSSAFLEARRTDLWSRPEHRALLLS